MDLEVMEFDLRKTVGEVIEILKEQARSKGLALTESVSPDVPARLQGDPVRLGQVLMNLVGNAIKFTDKGYVNINVVKSGGEEGVSLSASKCTTRVSGSPRKHGSISSTPSPKLMGRLPASMGVPALASPLQKN